MKGEDKINDELLIKDALSHLKKVTEAVYKTTDLFSDKEPLKWGLRNEGLAVLRLFISFENVDSHKRLGYLDKIIFKINRVIGLIELASSSSFIAGVNFNILKKEYEKIKNFMESGKFLDIVSSDLLGKDLDVSRLSQNVFLDNVSVSENYGDLKNGETSQAANKEDFIKDKESDKGQRGNFSMSVMSDTNNERKIKPLSNNNKEKAEMYDKTKKGLKGITERGKRIMEIINLKGDKRISVNEACGSFKKISKKTIQRELKKLTQQGFLKYEGDKRWRVYKAVGSSTF